MGLFARQRWRAWIETGMSDAAAKAFMGSPVSDGGRGLKLSAVVQGYLNHARSPVSDGGRGLKQARCLCCVSTRLFARQRWRAWIETR